MGCLIQVIVGFLIFIGIVALLVSMPGLGLLLLLLLIVALVVKNM